MSTPLSITTRYLTGDRWNSNSGGVIARSLGRQRTVRWNPALSPEQNHAAAVLALAGALANLGAVPEGFKVQQTRSNDSGTRRVFEVVAP